MGVQFHPEKQIYEWYDDVGLNHEWESIQMNRYFADTFVKQTREQSNVAGDFSKVQGMIIENFDFFVTDLSQGNVYMFNWENWTESYRDDSIAKNLNKNHE